MAYSPAHIRVANFDDYDGIARLAMQYLGETDNQSEWNHLWVSNPVYKQHPDWPIGWVLENREKQIVGYVGNIPLSYEFQGQRILAATSRSLVVDLQYRTYSLPLLSRFFGQKHVDLFIETTVNPNAVKAQALFSTQRVPVGAWNRSAFWITDHQGFLGSLLTMKGLRLMKPFAYPLSVGLRLKNVLSKKKGARRDGVKISECSGFDDRFDRFWHQLKSNRSALLLATRSREVLEWHFKYALAQNRALIATVGNGDAITAYAIFNRQDNAAFGLKRLRLIDYQTIDGSSDLTSILSWALKQCRSRGIHMLETIGFPADKQRRIDELKPHKRELPSWLYFYKTNNTQLAECLQNPEVWDPSCFDGDASL